MTPRLPSSVIGSPFAVDHGLGLKAADVKRTDLVCHDDFHVLVHGQDAFLAKGFVGIFNAGLVVADVQTTNMVDHSGYRSLDRRFI